jgi:hypothetical protein
MSQICAGIASVTNCFKLVDPKESGNFKIPLLKLFYWKRLMAVLCKILGEY